MPYGKSTYHRAPQKRRVRYSKSKEMVVGHGPTLLEQISAGIGSAAKVASAIAPIIEAINTESKYFDTKATFSTYNSATNSDLRCLTDGIPQGVTDSDRIGNSILAQDIQIRCAVTQFVQDSTPPVLGTFHRIMIFAWKINDLGGPTAAKLLEDPTNIYSPMNKDYTDQFVLLKDKHMTLQAPFYPPALGATHFAASVKWYKKVNWHMRWTDAGDDTCNHIWMYTMSTVTQSANAVSTTFYSRLNYTDN